MLALEVFKLIYFTTPFFLNSATNTYNYYNLYDYLKDNNTMYLVNDDTGAIITANSRQQLHSTTYPSRAIYQLEDGAVTIALPLWNTGSLSDYRDDTIYTFRYNYNTVYNRFYSVENDTSTICPYLYGNGYTETYYNKFTEDYSNVLFTINRDTTTKNYSLNNNRTSPLEQNPFEDIGLHVSTCLMDSSYNQVFTLYDYSDYSLGSSMGLPYTNYNIANSNNGDYYLVLHFYNKSLDYQDGYADGFATGQTENYQDGYDAGYDAGVLDGRNDTQIMIPTLIGAFVDTPFYYLNKIFGYTIFGVNLFHVVLSLVSLFIVSWIIKKVM